MRRILLYTVSSILLSSAYGQESLNKSVRLLIEETSVFLDSLPIDATSVDVEGYDQGSDYNLNANRLVWLKNLPNDTVIVSYRYLDFKPVYRNKHPRIIQPVFEENPFAYKPPSGFRATTQDRLSTAGNISRGLGFGNTQDVVVNSNLNLRLSGMLANDVKVLAVISDENNPIQPEGNTQQIQDFDQVFITLQKDSGKLTVGDFMMQKNKDSYFVNFYKKSRGLQFNNVSHTKKWRINQEAEVAIARGRFSRNTIEGIEGNAGPYRLSGSNGEIFIIVIAATEKVFLDGKLLTRGEDNDYVVNYNTGEITFTPKVLITRYSRIVVEFQYSDRNYARSVSRVGGQISKGDLTIYTNFYNEMDLKSQPFQQSLDAFDSTSNISALELLSQSGDGQAFISNIKEQPIYNADRVMYKKLVSGPNEYYEYADNPSENVTFYEVTFSNVGFGNGSYVQSQSAANGKVFEYVGQGLGDYEPIELLVAPRRLNMLNVGIVRQDSNKRTGFEFVVSGLDKNTLSSLDDADNLGYGIKTFNELQKEIGEGKWNFNSNINYELISSGFSFIERYRNVEFDRNWNKVITNPNSLLQLLPSLEHIGNVSLGLNTKDGQLVKNDFSLFLRPGNFTGYSNTSSVNLSKNEWNATASFQLLNSDNQSDSQSIGNNFIGLKTQLEKRLNGMSVGAKYNWETSEFSLADSLIGQSYGFDEVGIFARSTGKKKWSYSLDLNQRQDRLPREGSFNSSTLGRSLSLGTQHKDAKNNRIQLLGTYRRLEIQDTSLSSSPEENTLQSRLELDYKLFKKFIRTKTFYQVGTGQEQRREFQYLQIQAGNGIYIWNDYDSNGIKTLNEFEIASDLDRGRADYIRVFTPVAGFFSTNSNKFSQTLEISPSVLVKRKGKKQPFFGRFYSISSFISENKVLPSDLASFLNPLTTNEDDSLLMSSSKKFRSSLFYNRSNPVYGLDYTYLQNNSKALLTNGFDGRSTAENKINGRLNIGSKLTLLSSANFGTRSYTSEFFSTRSYSYNFNQFTPRIQYIYNNVFRVEVKLDYFAAQNEIQFGGDFAENTELGVDLKLTRAEKGTIQLGGSLIDVTYTGDPNSTLGYELLRGLQNGNNITWKLNYQRTISNNIQFVVTYDGRKSELNDAIHIGRVLARYLF